MSRWIRRGLRCHSIRRESLTDARIHRLRRRLADTWTGRGFDAMPASYYLYVDDADPAQQRAIAAGAKEVSPVRDQPYGDRQCGVRDTHGNYWWISQRLEGGYE
jgi:PhnB protein